MKAVKTFTDDINSKLKQSYKHLLFHNRIIRKLINKRLLIKCVSVGRIISNHSENFGPWTLACNKPSTISGSIGLPCFPISPNHLNCLLHLRASRTVVVTAVSFLSLRTRPHRGPRHERTYFSCR